MKMLYKLWIIVWVSYAIGTSLSFIYNNILFQLLMLPVYFAVALYSWNYYKLKGE